ncbi:MAG: YtxH domain-containing protein [Vicinamibacterales bacterium]
MSRESTRLWAGIGLGAVVGSVVGYLVFTEQGRRTVSSLQRTVDDVAQALGDSQSVVRQLSGVAEEGRRVVEAFRRGRTAPRTW